MSGGRGPGTPGDAGYRARAADFVTREKEFQLGFLPTEQPHPLTRGLESAFAGDPAAGIRLLQRVDREVARMARTAFAGDAFAKLVADGTAALRQGRRLVFSGCGATGRLSILLEAMWRAAGGEGVLSIMTGGDYALVRSVEFFEDYGAFGRRQAEELGLARGDLLVGITEGGETASVLGSVEAAVERGAGAFLACNNPAPLLRERLERCRRVIDNPAVTVLDLHCGPMAVAGSTRMQATTAGQLVAGAALEEIAARLRGGAGAALDFAAAFDELLDRLGSERAISVMAEQIELEAGLYRRGGLVTYFAGDYLLDIFTDTTERSPTFALPPFRKSDDTVSPQSWAFVKNPLFATPEAWRRCLAREPRCLGWGPDDYRRLGAAPEIAADPPRLDRAELMKFAIGFEDMPGRYSRVPNAAVLVGAGAELEAAFRRRAASYQARRRLALPFGFRDTRLRLLERLGVKLMLNTISTGTMARMGRISGNWMSHVAVSNKKLLDRATRLVAELAGLDYAAACAELFRSLEELERAGPGASGRSPVQHALARLEAGRAGGAGEKGEKVKRSC